MILMKRVEDFAGQAAVGTEHPSLQGVQAHFRMQLVEEWQIPPGTKVLEIGCGQVLRKVYPWTRYLCFSEWDLEPQTLDQVAHLLAVLIQGQVEAYKTNSDTNVRTPFSRTRFKQLLQETDWTVSAEATADSTQLQDAGWEIDICLRSALIEAEAMRLPAKHQELLASQVDTLREMAARGNNRSLFSYSILAKREP